MLYNFQCNIQIFYNFYPHSALNALHQNEESVFVDACCSNRVTTNLVLSILKFLQFLLWWNYDKSVSCRNLIECSLCLTMVHLKSNNLNVVDAEIIKFFGSDRFWICMFCSSNLFPFATLNYHKLYQTLKLVSAIFYQIFIFHQMTALQKLWKMFFISSKKLFLFSRYSNFSISILPSFSPCRPLL